MKQVRILTQYETASVFAERVNKNIKELTMAGHTVDVQFLMISDGRQACNLIWNEDLPPQEEKKLEDGQQFDTQAPFTFY